MLIGNGALANYHDLEPDDREDFERWHSVEHIPERVAVPGFMRGRRYVAVDSEPEYFILYEGSEVDVFCAPAYLERLDNPTPWTTRVSATMALTLRSACVVTETLGQGTGDYCATWQISPVGDRASLRRELVKNIFPTAGDISDILGIHLLEASADVTGVDTLEKTTRPGDDGMSDWIVMVEADTTHTLDAVYAVLSQNFSAELNQSHWSTYQLQAMLRDVSEL